MDPRESRYIEEDAGRSQHASWRAQIDVLIEPGLSLGFARPPFDEFHICWKEWDPVLFAEYDPVLGQYRIPVRPGSTQRGRSPHKVSWPLSEPKWVLLSLLLLFSFLFFPLLFFFLFFCSLFLKNIH